MTWGNKDLRPSLNATGMTIRGLIALVLRNQRCPIRQTKPLRLITKFREQAHRSLSRDVWF